jgi:CrcB protein
VYNLTVLDALWKILSVAAGGAAGAVARYLINISPLAAVFEKFPLPTFVINVSGSFLIGFLLILLTDKWEVGDNLRMAVIVGFLGAFTTFSTLEMEIYGLAKERDLTMALLYLVLSVAAGFLGVAAGVWLGRWATFK